MRPRHPTPDDLLLRTLEGALPGHIVEFGPPAGVRDYEVQPLCAIRAVSILDSGPVPCIEVPWEPEGSDLEELAAGGTLWLTLWSERMPPVALAVQPAQQLGTTPAPSTAEPGGEPEPSGSVRVSREALRQALDAAKDGLHLVRSPSEAWAAIQQLEREAGP